MTIGMLVAGIACLLAGGLAIGFGIPINEFGLGNTLILAGAITACTGLIILSLCVVVRELRSMAGRVTGAAFDARQQPATAALPRPAPGDPAVGAPDVGDAPSGPPPMPSDPWLEEAVQRDRARQEPPPVPAVEPQPTKQRRNLMFSSTSRRERERAQARVGDPAPAETRPATAVPPAAETSEPPPATFDDAWPKSERRPADVPPQRRPMPARPAAPGAEQPSVTVLKSGVVDGMAYSLYSDGSIEAQMPEGMMRFASIDELRAHLDQRP
jgi:hypothetical protein